MVAAERAKCKIVYSEDMPDDQIYDTIEVRNPFKN